MATAAQYDARIERAETAIRKHKIALDAAVRERHIVIDGWHSCRDCPHVSRTVQGMSAHRGLRHPQPLPAPVCEANSPQIRGRVFHCADCGAEPNTIKKLARHAWEKHRRLPLKGERVPVEPSPGVLAA